MKTIRELNQEAGEWVAHNWLKAVRSILQHAQQDGVVMHPARLSSLQRGDLLNYLPEFVREAAQKANPRWCVSDRNFPQIMQAAKMYAADLLRYLPNEHSEAVSYFQQYPTVESTKG